MKFQLRFLKNLILGYKFRCSEAEMYRMVQGPRSSSCTHNTVAASLSYSLVRAEKRKRQSYSAAC